MVPPPLITVLQLLSHVHPHPPLFDRSYRPVSASEQRRAAVFGLAVLGVVVCSLLGCGGFFGVRALIRAHVAARFAKDLPACIALSSALPADGVDQAHLPPSRGITGKVKGKMVVVNVNEKRIDDLYFALPDDLRASNPEEVATVVLLTSGITRLSGEGPISSFTSVEYVRFVQVKVFDWQSKAEIASRTILGRFPDTNLRSVEESVTGPKPDDAQVLTFLTGLPRQ